MEADVSKAQEASPAKPLIAVMTNRDTASRVKIIADRRGLTMAEAIDKYAGQAIQKEYRKCLDEMDAELQAGG